MANFSVPSLLRICHLGSVSRPASTFELLADVLVGRQEPFRQRRERRNLVRIQWSNEPRSDQDHQLITVRLNGLALKQVTDYRQPGQARDLVERILREIVEKPGDRKRLPVPKLDVGL